MRKVEITEQLIRESLPEETFSNIQYVISAMKRDQKPTVPEFINSLINIMDKHEGALK